MKKSILIVEDERPLSKALRIKLGAEGFSVSIAEDGEKAIEEIKHSSFDLILLDLVTPRLDGLGVLNHLQKTGNNVPVFVISNLSQKGDIKDARTAGAEQYFVKSDISLNDVVKTIKKKFS